MLTMWLRNVLTISESLVWDRRFGWFLVVINSVSSRESTCNIAACIATSSPSSPAYYAPPLSTPLIPRRRHQRSTAPPLPPSSMPSVFLDIKGGMPTVSQSCVCVDKGGGPSGRRRSEDRHDGRRVQHAVESSHVCRRSSADHPCRTSLARRRQSQLQGMP